MGELPLGDYREWVEGQCADEPRHVFLYAGDAEIFGYRPGRYAAEPPIHGDEWAHMAETLHHLRDHGLHFSTPSEIASKPQFEATREVKLCTAAAPIPVKKQPKYNVTRWALTGRDDVGLNAACHRRAAALEKSSAGAKEWREL